MTARADPVTMRVGLYANRWVCRRDQRRHPNRKAARDAPSVGQGEQVQPFAFRLSPYRCALLFVVLTCAGGCYHKVNSAPGETFSAGYILADKQPKFSHDFIVRNTTGRPVEIHNVVKSCTCSSFELGNYRLAAGEATKLTIKVDVINSYMHKLATCVLKTDHPTFNDWNYTITFVSVPFVVADPDVLNLGSFTADGGNLGTARNATLDLFADSKIELARHNFTVPDELELEGVSSPEVRQLQRGVWNSKYDVSIRLSPKGRETVLRNAQSGIITKAIQLAAGAAKSRRWQYSVYWQVRASLEFHPSCLSFGNLLDGTDDHCKSVVISSTTAQKFRIVSVKRESRDVRIETAVEKTDDAVRQLVKFKALRYADTGGRPTDSAVRFLSGTIHVQTSDRLRPTVEIPWSAVLDPSVERRSEANPQKGSPELKL